MQTFFQFLFCTPWPAQFFTIVPRGKKSCGYSNQLALARGEENVCCQTTIVHRQKKEVKSRCITTGTVFLVRSSFVLVDRDFTTLDRFRQIIYRSETRTRQFRAVRVSPGGYFQHSKNVRYLTPRDSTSLSSSVFARTFIARSAKPCYASLTKYLECERSTVVGGFVFSLRSAPVFYLHSAKPRRFGAKNVPLTPGQQLK